MTNGDSPDWLLLMLMNNRKQVIIRVCESFHIFDMLASNSDMYLDEEPNQEYADKALEKYPVEKSRGISVKYDKLAAGEADN